MILSDAELAKLSDVIGELETKTSGEIRLMIVKRSASIHHVPYSLWSLLTALALVAVWFWPQPIFAHFIFLPILIAVTFVVAKLLSSIPEIQRRMLHFKDMNDQVWARAEVEFHREGLSDTTSHTGVLIFVSLFEKQAVVLADKAIASKVPEGTWNQVIHTVVEGARTGAWAAKLEQALRECGSYLAAHFPPSADNQNELSNAVIIKD